MKKTVSILLAALLICALPLTASAASIGKINGVIAPFTDKDYSNMEANPGEEYLFVLKTDMFSWTDGDGNSTDTVTSSQLSSANIKAKVSYDKKASKDILKTVDITTTRHNGKSVPAVKIAFVDNYNKTNSTDFEFTVYLTYKGSKVSDSEVYFSGTFQHELVEVDDDEDYVDLSDGRYAEPLGSIKEIEVYLGEGIIIKTRMYKNKIYGGTVTEGITEADDKIIDAYPEIEYIYRLSTTNLSDGKVIFEDLDGDFHVYDEKGEYVGTADKAHKYSSVYYVSPTKLNLSSSGSSSSSSSSSRDRDDDDDDEDDSRSPSSSSSAYVPIETDDNDDDYYYNYINDNPSTGSRAMVAVAAFAAAVSVTFVAVNTRKKH